MHDQFGQHFTDGRCQLKAGAGKTEGMQQAWCGGAGAEHRLVIRCFAFDPAPTANDHGVAQCRYHFGQAGECGKGGCHAWPGGVQGQLTLSSSTAEHDVAALYLARIEAAADDAQTQVHQRRQWFGDAHVGINGLLWYGLAETQGDVFAPGAAAIEQKTTTHTDTTARLQYKIITIEDTGIDCALLQKSRAGPFGGAGKGGSDQAWIGMTVASTQRAAVSTFTDPGVALAQSGGVQQFQFQAVASGHVAVVQQFLHVGGAAGQFEMTTGAVFAIAADDLRQLLPDGMGTLGQRQLTGRAALTPDAAIIDTAGLGTAPALFQYDDRALLTAQHQRGRGAHEATADDGDVGFHDVQEATHAGSPLGSAASAALTGIGLMGA